MTLFNKNILNQASFLMKQSEVQESHGLEIEIPVCTGMTEKLNVVITTK